jgi:hypothetical protein
MPWPVITSNPPSVFDLRSLECTKPPSISTGLPSVIIFSAKGRTAFAKAVLIRFYSMRLQTWFASSKFRRSAFRPNLIVFLV